MNELERKLLRRMEEDRRLMTNKNYWLYTFAGQAMQGMCNRFPEFGRSHAEIIAKQSIEVASALLAELEKEPSGE